MKRFILYIWQLPQNIIGWIITLFLPHAFTSNGCEFYKWNGNGVSLGNYIIIPKYKRTIFIVRHEYGHHIQSTYLGPLYLIVIGIPSAIGNILHRFIKFNYYKQPWEAWANRLGGV